jgi:hypothetical protein
MRKLYLLRLSVKDLYCKTSSLVGFGIVFLLSSGPSRDAVVEENAPLSCAAVSGRALTGV